jgi:autotransporter-associated beta strand protein
MRGFTGVVLVALGFSAAQARADEYWSAPSGDWSNPANWSGSNVPQSTDYANVNNSGTVDITLPGAVCSNLGVWNGYVQMQSGSLATTGQISLSRDDSNDHGSFTQLGGTVSAAFLVMGGPWGSSGTYNLSGGQLNLSGMPNYIGQQCLGLGIGQNSSSPSTFAQSGGTASVVGAIIVGGGWGASGAYNLTGGRMVAGTEAIGEDDQWGQGSSGTFTQSGGTNSAGSVVLGYFGGDSGTFNLNGGVLSLATGPSLGGGSGTFNLGGGTLGASAPWSSSLNMNPTGINGPGTVDTSGGDIGLSGALSGTGGLVKAGTGTLTLVGPNTYSGGTSITAGTIAAGAAGALSPYSDMNVIQGMLDASGSAETVKSLTVGSGGLLTLGIGNVLTSSGTANLAGGLVLTGTAGSLPVEVLAYASESGKFATVTGLPAGDALRYGATELDLVSATPEPTTVALLGAGAAGLLAYRRRRKRVR